MNRSRPAPAASHSDDNNPVDGESGDLSYAQALAEIESILDALERDSVDVDELATQVQRAATLLRFCRGRLVEARMTVEQIVSALDDDTDEPSGGHEQSR